MFNLLFEPNRLGYDIFTSYIHRGCLTGLIHGIYLPIASLGLWSIVFGLLSCVIGCNRHYSEDFTVSLVSFTTLLWTLCVIRFVDPLLGIFTGLFYYFIGVLFIAYAVNGSKVSGRGMLVRGIISLALSVGMMEFIGHWLLEGAGSDVTQLMNSIFHTPIYGMRAIYNFTFGVGECA